MAIPQSNKAVRNLRLPTTNYTGTPVQVIPAQHGDANSRVLKVRLYDDTGNIDATVYKTAILQTETPMGDTVVAEATIGSDGITCELQGAMLANSGRLVCNVILGGQDENGNNVTLSSQTFYVHIARTAGLDTMMESGDIITLITLIDEVKALSELVDDSESGREGAESVREDNELARQKSELGEDLSGAQGEFGGRIGAEKQRVANEAVRQAEEITRNENEVTRNTSEDGRQTNEQARADAESLRVTAEGNRETAENTRDNNESTRQSGESTRALAEQDRENNESARISQEDSRVLAESSRVSAESERESTQASYDNAEQQRVSNETAREANETTRQSNEATRQLNENTRASQESSRVEAEGERTEAFGKALQDVDDAIDRMELNVTTAKDAATDSRTSAQNSEDSAAAAGEYAEEISVMLQQLAQHFGTIDGSTGVATLTTVAKNALGASTDTITLTNDTEPVTGYTANEAGYYVVVEGGSVLGLSLAVGDWLRATASGWYAERTGGAVTGVKGNQNAVYRIGEINLSPEDLLSENQLATVNKDITYVDNTRDLDKPISIAQRAEFDRIDGEFARKEDLENVADEIANIPKIEIVDSLSDTAVDKALSANMGKVLQDTKADISAIPAKVTVTNNLTSTSTTAALSANMGRQLKDLIDGIHPSLEAITGFTASNAGVLQWDAVPEALSYDIWVSGRLFETTDTNFTFVGDTGNYSVKVRARNNLSVSPWTTAKTINYSMPAIRFSSNDGNPFQLTIPKSSRSGTLYVSIDGIDWTSVSNTAAYTSPSSPMILVKGKITNGVVTGSGTSYRWMIFPGTARVSCSGDIRTLLDWENPAATQMEDSCYRYMFNGCTSLTTAPSLPATTLASNCYAQMFGGCPSLTTAPSLPATTLAGWCYQGMFGGCPSLTTAPSSLPATTLAYSCYGAMFYDCTSLTTAPSLPATTLDTYCYDSMFENCTSLKSIEVNFKTWTTGTAGWLANVSPTGTFKKPSALPNTTGADRIPSGWTVVNK